MGKEIEPVEEKQDLNKSTKICQRMTK